MPTPAPPIVAASAVATFSIMNSSDGRALTVDNTVGGNCEDAHLMGVQRNVSTSGLTILSSLSDVTTTKQLPVLSVALLDLRLLSLRSREVLVSNGLFGATRS